MLRYLTRFSIFSNHEQKIDSSSVFCYRKTIVKNELVERLLCFFISDLNSSFVFISKIYASHKYPINFSQVDMIEMSSHHQRLSHAFTLHNLQRLACICVSASFVQRLIFLFSSIVEVPDKIPASSTLSYEKCN